MYCGHPLAQRHVACATASFSTSFMVCTVFAESPCGCSSDSLRCFGCVEYGVSSRLLPPAVCWHLVYLSCSSPSYRLIPAILLAQTFTILIESGQESKYKPWPYDLVQ